MSEISQLICGSTDDEGLARSSLLHLESTIDAFSARAINYLGESPPIDTITFGPFCSRVFLENACTAFVGRLDCFRLLYLSGLQTSTTYDYGRRMAAAFSWSNDVMGDHLPVKDLHADQKQETINRALLSKHAEYMYWKPAVNRMIDFVNSKPNQDDDGLSTLRAIDAETFVPKTRGRASQLYSSLSKAVHWEFLAASITYDADTVREYIRETCLLVAELGLLLHFVPTAYASLPKDDAVSKYLSFRRSLA